MTHPVHETESGIINLYSGGKINLLDPRPEQIDIRDIAHALSNICRFGGHTREFYSVAQHSCLVSHLIYSPEIHSIKGANELQLIALLHDASEAYLGDVVKPLKHRIALAYEPLEMLFTIAINRRFGIDLQAIIATQQAVKYADKRALEMEFNALFSDDPTDLWVWAVDYYPTAKNNCWSPEEAEEIFLSTFNELSK